MRSFATIKKADEALKILCPDGRSYNDHPCKCFCGLLPQIYRGRLYNGTMDELKAFIYKELKRLENQSARKVRRKLNAKMS